jgi:hypothetical protein
MKNLLKQKGYLILLLIFLFNLSVKAQDLIITNEGDTLNCKITKIKDDFIYFTFKHKEEIRNTLIPISGVKYYESNHYSYPLVPSNRLIHQPFPHYRAAINGGWSYMTAQTSNDVPSEFEDFVEELKSGWNCGADFTYYFSKSFGIGAAYDNFRSKNQMDLYLYNNGTVLKTYLSSDISVYFIGPYFSSRILDSSMKNNLFFNFGFGYLGYKNNTSLVQDYTIKGNSLGFRLDCGYDINLFNNFALGLELTYTLGEISKYDISYGNAITTTYDDEEENISHINLTIGLRYIK